MYIDGFFKLKKKKKKDYSRYTDSQGKKKQEETIKGCESTN